MRTKKILIAILLLGALLRLVFLATNPPHLTPDEASLGYNAYSILKTGKDEYGKILPVIFKSFGDYKPGLYVYLTVPFIGVFGLNEWSVRLPSAVAGVFSIYLLYLTVRELFPKRKYLPLVSSFLLAIAPWHMHFSRGAWEVNVSLTLTLAGIYFFIKSFDKAKNIIFSALFFGITLVTYQGAKLASAIVLVLLVITFWKEVKKLVTKNTKYVMGGVGLGLFVSLPIILSLFQGKTGRLTVFSLFSYPRPKDYTQAFLDQGDEKFGSLSYYLYHSETLNFKREILGRWFNHLSDRFLYFEGDWQNPRHSAPHNGMFVLADMVLVIMGFIALARINSRKTRFILFWAGLASLPAILSRDEVHAVRSYNMLVPLVMMDAFGAMFIWENLKKNGFFKKALLILFGLYYLGTYIYFLDAYFVHLPKSDSKYWRYGYKQIVETITPIQGNYELIQVEQSYAQPYIYFLFYQRYDPAKYQKEAKLTESGVGDVGQVERLGNIRFMPIDWHAGGDKGAVLLAGNPAKIPPGVSTQDSKFKLIKEIEYLDGNPAFRIVEVK